MVTIALTGGVACGKSTVGKGILQHVSRVATRYFDCDACVGELLTETETLGRLADVAGKGLIDVDGASLDRKRFREALYIDPRLRKKVEEILHPLVLTRARKFVRELNGLEVLIVIEVPLLYEVDFPVDRDMVMAVGASERAQIQRLVEKRKIDRKTARGIIDAQISVQEKMNRSDWVIWNDGSRGALTSQLKLASAQLERIFIRTNDK